MPQSLSRVLIHLVFSTKNRAPSLLPSVQTELHVRSRNRRYLHQKPGKAPSEDDISRRIPALSRTPSGRLRRALCLGLRISTGPSGRESLLDSSPRPLAWAERSRALGAEKNGQTPERRLAQPPLLWVVSSRQIAGTGFLFVVVVFTCRPWLPQ